MKALIMTLFISISAYAFATQVYKGDTLNIEGYVDEDKSAKQNIVEDQELQMMKRELERQQKTIVVNKVKSKAYKKLAHSTEKLTEVHQEMMEEKIDSQVSINKFNQRVAEQEKRMKCLENNDWDRSKCPKKRL